MRRVRVTGSWSGITILQAARNRIDYFEAKAGAPLLVGGSFIGSVFLTQRLARSLHRGLQPDGVGQAQMPDRVCSQAVLDQRSRTSQIVDSEVKRIISESFERAKQVLQDNMDLLHAVAAALLDRETLTRDDVEILARGEKLPPRAPPPSTPAKPLAPSAQPKTEPKRNPPLLGGPEPSPA